MDHARKLGKPDRASIWKQRCSPPCMASDKPLLKDEQAIEDKRLANWKKWLTDRKKLCKNYGKRTERDHRDLLMNQSGPEEFRQKLEIKELTEMTVGLENKRKPDEYRANLGFWVTPEFLPNHGNPNLPNISITLTKKQLNGSTEVQQITLPELIREEINGVSPQKQATSVPSSKRTENSKILGPKLKREIKLHEARKLAMKGLAVKGRKLGEKRAHCPKIPVITVTGSDTFDDKKLHSDDAIGLKIQDREITFIKAELKDESDETTSLDEYSWSLIFKSTACEISEGAIRLENVGTSTITYHWRYGSSGRTMLIPQTTPRDSPFFFNKNKNLILPGQVTVVRVWFRSAVSRSATEFWTLITDPKISRKLLVFRFWGCCSYFEGYSDSIERYLERRVRDTKIREIIDKIVDNVSLEKCLSLPAYTNLFLEREIFEAKNPRYHYHSPLVDQFRNIYQMAASHDSPPWSLSLNELRRIILQLGKAQVKNETLVRFNQLCRNSLEPNLHKRVGGNTKLIIVYNLLCSFVNKFEAENEYVGRECFSARPNTFETESQTPSCTTIAKNAPLTPRINSKKNRLSQSRKPPSESPLIIDNRETSRIIPHGQSLLYKQVFHMRIRAMLVDTIVEISGVVDTINNLQPPRI